MSRKKKDQIEETMSVPEEIVEVSEVRKYKDVALGIHRVQDGPNYKYILVEVPYDLESGDVGFVKELTRGTREDIIDQFKIAVVDRGMFGND